MEQLKQRLDQLDPNEHEQVFTIISKWTKEYTRSDTGIYVSSDKLPKGCIAEIEQYVNFCFDQHKHLEEAAVERQKYEKLAKTGHGSS